MTHSRESAERWITRILRGGIWASALFMVAGIVLLAVQGGVVVMPQGGLAPADVLQSLFASPTLPSGTSAALALLFIGLLILMLTPFLRVLTTIITFALEREWNYVAVGLVVFGMLLSELILAFS